MQAFYNQEYNQLAARMPGLKTVSDFSDILIIKAADGQFGPWSFIKNAPALITIFNDQLTSYMDAVQDVTPLEDMVTDERVRRYISDNIPLTQKFSEVLSRYIDAIHSAQLLKNFLEGPLKGHIKGNPTLAEVLHAKFDNLINKCEKQDCWSSFITLGLIEQLVEKKRLEGYLVVQNQDLQNTYYNQLAKIAELALLSTDEFIDFMGNIDWKYISRHSHLKNDITHILSGKDALDDLQDELSDLKETYETEKSTLTTRLQETTVKNEAWESDKSILLADLEETKNANVALNEQLTSAQKERLETTTALELQFKGENEKLQSDMQTLNASANAYQGKAKKFDQIQEYISSPGLMGYIFSNTCIISPSAQRVLNRLMTLIPLLGVPGLLMTTKSARAFLGPLYAITAFSLVYELYLINEIVKS